MAGGNDRFAGGAEFDALDAYKRYASPPRPRSAIDRLLKPMLGTRHAVQLVTPE